MTIERHSLLSNNNQTSTCRHVKNHHTETPRTPRNPMMVRQVWQSANETWCGKRTGDKSKQNAERKKLYMKMLNTRLHTTGIRRTRLSLKQGNKAKSVDHDTVGLLSGSPILTKSRLCLNQSKQWLKGIKEHLKIPNENTKIWCRSPEFNFTGLKALD